MHYNGDNHNQNIHLERYIVLMKKHEYSNPLNFVLRGLVAYSKLVPCSYLNIGPTEGTILTVFLGLFPLML